MREPALCFRTAGKHKEQPGGTGSLTDLTQEKPKPRGTRKSQKERLKAQLAKALAGRPTESGQGQPSTGGTGDPTGKAKGRGAKRDNRGRYLTDKQQRGMQRKLP